MEDLNAGGSTYTEDDFFLVLIAFQLAYAIFEIPSGWLGDTRGPRMVRRQVRTCLGKEVEPSDGESFSPAYCCSLPRDCCLPFRS